MKALLWLVLFIVAGAVIKSLLGKRGTSSLESAQSRISRQNLSLQKLKDFLIDKAVAQCGAGIRIDRLAVERLNECAEKSLTELKTHGRAEITLPFLSADANGPHHFNLRILIEEI